MPRRHVSASFGGLLVTLLLPLGCGDPGPAPGASHGTFEPSWSDEFDGTTVDPAKWHVLDEWVQAWPETPWRRNWKRENVTGEDGALVIRTVREPYGFSTGAVMTADWGKPVRFQQAFGRFEARVRFPRQQGHWCAFWLEPCNFWNALACFLAGRQNGLSRTRGN